MTGRRAGAILIGGAAVASLAVALLLARPAVSLRPSRPAAPSPLERGRPDGAVAPAPSPDRTVARPAPPPVDRSPSPERLAARAASRLLADPASDAGDRLRALVLETTEASGRAAIYRAIRSSTPRPRLAAVLAREADPAAIPAAAAALARLPGGADGVARLVGRAGPGRAPDVLEEILSLDDDARPEALVAAAAAAPGESAREKRLEIVERLGERLGERGDVDTAAWLDREPDSEIRDRLVASAR